MHWVLVFTGVSLTEHIDIWWGNSSAGIIADFIKTHFSYAEKIMVSERRMGERIKKNKNKKTGWMHKEGK